MAKIKRTKNNLQNITHKTKDRVTQSPLKTGDELCCSGRVSNSILNVISMFCLILLHVFLDLVYKTKYTFVVLY
jgi:hypothetical protein